MSATDYGREPITIIELVQPRCALTFGTAPCNATGTPKCYQTWGTCKDRANITPTDSFVWRFSFPDAGVYPMYEEAPGVIKTNPIPMLESVSAGSSELNIGGILDGKSALGIRAGITVQMRDIEWDDHVGDPYLSARTLRKDRTFWALWKARNVFYNGMILRRYTGYRDDPGGWVRADFILESVDGPTADGRVTLRGRDPLAQASKRKFPPASNLRLVNAIDATQTTGIILEGPESDVSLLPGNVSGRFVGIGSEAIAYTGWVSVGTGQWELTGVLRARFSTEGASHSAGDAAQRIGRFLNIQGWRAAAQLIDNWSGIPSGYRPVGQWNTEGNDYMGLSRVTRNIVEPTDVDELLGQLCQQCQFSIWWDERTQTIPLQANRPPQEAPLGIDDMFNILAGTSVRTEDRDAMVTRVLVRYAPRDPFKLRDPGNYRFARLTIEADIEAPQASGTIKEMVIDAPWIIGEFDAFSLCSNILQRYRFAPEFISLEVDAKDAGLSIGDVCDITTFAVVDSEGNPLVSRWQVIRAEETEAGHRSSLRFQSYYFFGRYAKIMPDTANDYASATDEEKENGGYIADSATLKMPDGSDPYLIQ